MSKPGTRNPPRTGPSTGLALGKFPYYWIGVDMLLLDNDSRCEVKQAIAGLFARYGVPYETEDALLPPAMLEELGGLPGEDDEKAWLVAELAMGL